MKNESEPENRGRLPPAAFAGTVTCDGDLGVPVVY
jgi:hypothetical protein